jgi:hypothetical protein
MNARSAGTFLTRLVLYAVAVALAVLLARAEWRALGLDALIGGDDLAVARVERWQARLPIVLSLGTLLLATFGRVSRPIAALLLWALVGAIITAPFAIARALGGGG